MIARNTFRSDSVLYDVESLADGTAWAVGARLVGSAPNPTRWCALVERWNGHAWKLMPAPAGLDDLTVVAVAGRSQVWAFGGHDSTPYAARWDGRQWTVTATGDKNTRVTDAVGMPNGEVWAVQAAQLWRWDGSAWLKTPVPFRVTAIDQRRGELWAIGDDTVEDVPAAARWNGASWTMTRMPDFPQVLAEQHVVLKQVAVGGRGDVWAQGDISADCDENCSPGRILVMHWNGGKWSYWLQRHTEPVLVSRIERRRLTGLWSAGDDVVLYMSDGRWARAIVPGIRHLDNHVHDVVVRQGSARLWAVGSVSDENGSSHSISVIWTALTV
ncbi:hypothetical protein J5X84_07915 [Streptosporangiaceae bacterium NEAU-GS5]|nr:hypothetical protein [Streptosporangiaceae bacterium NEAU-GS5]